jgi:putative transcriptional regulator
VVVPPLTGRLLVATPLIGDPNFERTVVLVLEHSDDGAIGVVLNRPTDTELVEPLPDWGGVAAEPRVVFVGGPVGEGSAIGVAWTAEPATGDREDGAAPVAGPLSTVDLSRPPGEVRPGVEAVRVFAGYAGWGGGQVEDEIEAGAWVVADTRPGDAFSPDPARLWVDVLRRQPGRLAWLANCPPDPSVN